MNRYYRFIQTVVSRWTNPVWIYVSTAVFPQPASTARYGVNFPQMANGILNIPTEGWSCLRIMAGCGKLKSGQYALVEATAIHCYGKHRKIRTNQSWFGSFFNKIKFRWYGPGQKCKLQIRSGRDYGDNIFVCFLITDLWKDYRMDASDRRNTFNQE